MDSTLISSSIGVIVVLAGIPAFFFMLEKKTQWKLFNFFPPLLFIYLLPVVFSNTNIIPNESPVYDFMGVNLLPMFLTIMLLDVDVMATIRVMGKGIFVMLAGTLGVVVGAPIAFLIVKAGLGEGAWQGFGALAGSWIGGTGNMLAVAQMIDLDDTSVNYGYAVIADNAVYLIWLPIMLGSKNMAKWFDKFTKVPKDRLEKMNRLAGELTQDKGEMMMRHFLYLIFFGALVTALATWFSGMIPVVKTSDGITIFSANTYKILLVTIMGISLSFTKASKIPGSHAFSMALIYMFVARMGARADLSNIDGSLFWFLLGAYIWIFIHGGFLLAAARIFKVDVHTAAIASAANIGGAASAPIVAAYHNRTLVPVSILMAMLGYAIGNPAAFLTALLCKFVS
ncbi:MAG: DUF819 family protein [candidate division Zixibacteria bacterium]|nr:DUF819 family protein [candidate division Zixibacteria bacterium]